MTVAELISQLRRFPSDRDVCFNDDEHGYILVEQVTTGEYKYGTPTKTVVVLDADGEGGYVWPWTNSAPNCSNILPIMYDAPDILVLEREKP